VLLVSHDLGMVASYADHVVMLRHGKVVEEGDTQEILLAPKHEYTKMLLESLPQRGAGATREVGEEKLIEIDKVSVEFRKKPRFFWQRAERFRAVDGASLTLRKGETLAVVGESGSGKTTIGRTLVRLVEECGGLDPFRRQGAHGAGRPRPRRIPAADADGVPGSLLLARIRA
jgi:peptide/nickel transport system ATP-binding protein